MSDEMQVRMMDQDDWIGEGWIAFSREDFEVDGECYEFHGFFVYTDIETGEDTVSAKVVELVIESVHQAWDPDPDPVRASAMARELSPEEAVAFGKKHQDRLVELHSDHMVAVLEGRMED